MTEKNLSEAMTIADFGAPLNGRVTTENVQASIRRGSISAYQDEAGEWHISQAEFERLMAEVEPCTNCENQATSFVIVKYHHHHRVEFILCDRCAQHAHSAYSRKVGVLDVVTYPILSEGWLQP